MAAGVPGGNGRGSTSTHAALDPHAVGGELLGERRRRAAVREPVLIAVPRAGDAAVDDAALADRPVLVRAKIGERADLRRRRGTPRCARRPAPRRCARPCRGSSAAARPRSSRRALSASPRSPARSRQPAIRCSTATVPKPPISISGMSEVAIVLHDAERDMHHHQPIGDIERHVQRLPDARRQEASQKSWLVAAIRNRISSAAMPSALNGKPMNLP